MKKIVIGTTVNLLQGYDSQWLSEKQGNNPFFPLQETAIRETLEEELPTLGTWDYPIISLHNSLESLFNVLIPYQNLDPLELKMPHLPSGKLLLGNNAREDDIKQLSKTFGIDFSKEYAYALVRIIRQDGVHRHPSNSLGKIIVRTNSTELPDNYGVTDVFLKTMKGLQRNRNKSISEDLTLLNPEEANKYLGVFNKLGTHYVSEITKGDVIFQIFAYPRHLLDYIKSRYPDENELKGEQAVYFRQYTTEFMRDPSGQIQDFGYVQEYGNIMALSGSKILKDTLRDGRWKENLFAKRDSIFALFSERERKISLSSLNTDFSDETNISITLTSLASFTEGTRSLLWERIFKGAQIQVYNQPADLALLEENPAPFMSFDQLPDLISKTPTKQIKINKPTFDISSIDYSCADNPQMQILVQKTVEDVTIFTDYLTLEGKTDIDIPGDDFAIFGKLAFINNTEKVPTLTMSESAFKAERFYFDSFYGALRVQHSTGLHYTISDGLKYISRLKDGRNYPYVEADFRRVPPLGELEHIKSGIELSYSYTQIMFALCSKYQECQMRGFLLKSFEWYRKIIPTDCQDKRLSEIRISSLDRLHTPEEENLGDFVPVLLHKEYDDGVRDLTQFVKDIENSITDFMRGIEQQQRHEELVKNQQELNENILQTGTLLNGYIQTLFQNQKNISDNYNSVLENKQRDQLNISEKLKKTKKELDSYRDKMAEAVDYYEIDADGKKLDDSVKFALNIATMVFALGKSIKDPKSPIDIIKNIYAMIQAIQNFMKTMTKLNEFYRTLEVNVKKIIEIENAYQDISGLLTANIEWDVLSKNFNDVLDGGPELKSVSKLKNAFEMYVLKGKEYVLLLSSAVQVNREIYDCQAQKAITDDHRKALSNLNIKLKMVEKKKTADIDLVGLVGPLTALHVDMSVLLLRYFLSKEQALRYQYQAKPTALPAFDLNSIRKALASQNQKYLNAYEEQQRSKRTSLTDIEFIQEVSASALENANIYEFLLDHTREEFKYYTSVRVKAVKVSINGIEMTESKKYSIRLKYLGRPFWERSREKNLIVFNTISRELDYPYSVTGEALYTGEGKEWSENVTPITPFSYWQISLPNIDINKGLTFSKDNDIVKIKLTFQVEAYIDNVANRPASDILKDYALRSVMNGWDVVFSMNMAKVNDILAKQYEKMKKTSGYGGKINCAYETEPEKAGLVLCKCRVLKYDIEYGYPKLLFLKNNDKQVQIELPIENGTYKQYERYYGDKTPDVENALNALVAVFGGKVEKTDQHYILDTNRVEEDIKGKYLRALTSLQIIGDLKTTGEVSLCFDKASFSSNIETDLSNKFSDALTHYFAEHETHYVINKLSLEKYAVLDDLKPNKFIFRIVPTESNIFLQLFIMTGNRQCQTFVPALDMVPDEYQCCLLVNNKIVFESIIPKTSKNWTFESYKERGKDYLSVKTAKAVMGFNVDLSPFNCSSSNPEGTVTSSSSYYAVTNSWDFNNIKIQMSGSPDYQLKLSYDGKKTFKYTESHESCTYLFKTKCYTKKEDSETEIALNFSGKFNFSIEGTDENQTIKLKIEDTNLNVIGNGSGSCSGLAYEINKIMKTDVATKLREELQKIEFDGVSTFLLKNLIFTSNRIDLKAVYIPADLIVFGNFVDK